MPEQAVSYAVPMQQLLRTMVEYGGTDLHITTGSAPQIRLDGLLVPLKLPPMDAAQTKWLCYGVMSDMQKARLEEDLEVDFSFGLAGLARFRANVYSQRGAVAAAFRAIPEEVRTLEDLGLPPVVRSLCGRPRGLVLVAGATGSGKSTTLAAMIDKINEEEACHILTIEDPIEHIHGHKRGLVNQRELGADTRSFGKALRSALRQDTDVVMIGEMRDPETMEAALTIAETGHLVFGALHANSAVQAVSRIVDAFPAFRQPQVGQRLSVALEGIVCQCLVPRAGGSGRAVALEVLVPTPAVRSLIREGKAHKMYGTMQSGQGRHGMQTLNQSLSCLVMAGEVSREEALAYSGDRDELLDLI
jgi:twitching motility protein PilT